MAKEVTHVSDPEKPIKFDGSDLFASTMAELFGMVPADSTSKSLKLVDMERTFTSLHPSHRDANGNPVPVTVKLVITRGPMSQSEATLIAGKARQQEVNAEKRAAKDLASTQRTIEAVQNVAVNVARQLQAPAVAPKSQADAIREALEIASVIGNLPRQLPAGQ